MDQLEKLDGIIVQSNRLIEARYRMTLQEKRLILFLLKKINKDDVDFKKYKINIVEFSEMIGLDVHNQYKEMKKITRDLLTRPIEIDQDDGNITTQVTWLCFAQWEKKKGICSVQFHPELKPYLLELKREFTQIELSALMGLKSVYSTRILELLVQQEDFGKRKMTIDKIKFWCGIMPDEYKLYADLKVRVINKAKSEINEKTKYEVDYREIKESRSVVAIEWTIKEKTHFEKMQEAKAEIIHKELRSANALIEQLREYGLSLARAKKLLATNEESVVQNAVRAVNLQIERGHVKNTQAMLQSAIKERWHPEEYRKKTVT